MVGVYGSGGSRRPWGTSLAECAGRTWTDDEAAQRIPSTPRHATLPGIAGVPDDVGSTRITPISRHPERLAVHLAVEPAFGRYWNAGGSNRRERFSGRRGGASPSRRSILLGVASHAPKPLPCGHDRDDRSIALHR
jgi:hypothetical protein